MQIIVDSLTIRRAIDRIAFDITEDYAKKKPIMIGVLNGSFIFLSDLVRNLYFPLEIAFIKATSYQGTISTGKVEIFANLERQVIAGRHVILVEDIVDTGLTVHALLAHLDAQGVASVKLCSLLSKPSRRQIPVKIDYLGVTIPDEFVIGYGLDHDGLYRNLPQIWRWEGK